MGINSIRTDLDWQDRTLKEVAQKINVGFVGVCEPFYTSISNGILMIRTGNLEGTRLSIADAKYVTRSFHNSNKKSQVETGDILIARHGSSGQAVVVPSYIKSANTLNIVIIRADAKQADHNYLAYAINSHQVRKQVAELTAGSTQGVINTQAIAKLIIKLPRLNEQKEISRSLSELDCLIISFEKIITKKRNIKQATMQQLLTGKTRLPGFSDEWIEVNAGTLGKFKGGNGFPLKYQGSAAGEISFFKVSDMNLEGNEVKLQRSNNYISLKDIGAIGASLFPSGTIVFAKIGAAIFLERKKILITQGCIDNNMCGFVLEKKDVDFKFIYLCFLNTKFSDLVSTSALPVLSTNDLNNIKILLPQSLQEQSAIAKTIFDMDGELKILESKLAKLKLLKQGMMQELLTGRIRLV